MTIETPFWECLQKKSRYAGYWEGQNKQVKELMVVGQLSFAILHREGHDWVKKLELCREDPPDVIGTTNKGSHVAFEVTELVEQSMIECQKRGHATGKDWESDEVIKRLQLKLDEKGKRCFSKRDYDSVVLVIHTAERQLRPSVFGSVIAAHRFCRRGQIDEAYVIFPPGPPRLLYQSEQRICPYVQLSF